MQHSIFCPSCKESLAPSVIDDFICISCSIRLRVLANLSFILVKETDNMYINFFISSTIEKSSCLITTGIYIDNFADEPYVFSQETMNFFFEKAMSIIQNQHLV